MYPFHHRAWVREPPDAAAGPPPRALPRTTRLTTTGPRELARRFADTLTLRDSGDLAFCLDRETLGELRRGPARPRRRRRRRPRLTHGATNEDDFNDNDIDNEDDGEQGERERGLRVARDRGRGLSKNCAALRRLTRQRLRRLHAEHQASLAATILELRETVAAMERRRSLADAHALLWRTNRTAAVAEICRVYFAQFAQGYRAQDPARAALYAQAKDFIFATAEETLVCREYKGIAPLLRQWEKYTRHHGSITVRLVSITLIDEEDELVSICGAGEMRLGITEDTLRSLYPAFHAQAQRDPATQRIAAGLIGQEYVLSFDKVLHFNRHGRIFAHESKVHLATGLLGVLQDPFAATRLLQASLMTEDGHWKLPEENEVQDSFNDLPKLML